MPYTQAQHQRRQLDAWCRYLGYADFDTYLRAGGSVVEAVSVLANLRDSVGMAIDALAKFQTQINGDTTPIMRDPVIDLGGLPARNPWGNHVVGPEDTDAALAAAEAEANGDPVDPHNAHPQGDDAA